MSERHELLYCQDIHESGVAIQSYVLVIQDRMRYSAVIREFEIIGEAVGNMPIELKIAYPDIP